MHGGRYTPKSQNSGNTLKYEIDDSVCLFTSILKYFPMTQKAETW